MKGLQVLGLLLFFGSSLTDDITEEYDFILVGAGSAGSVLARRLTENGNFRVLLLEKGGEPNFITEIPALVAMMYFTENADKYFVEKQEGIGMGLVDERIAWTRGQGLGGTSLLNYMIYTHGHKEDYNRIAKLGNPGWSYEEIAPYCKKLEKYSGDNVDSASRGTEGELDSTQIPTKSDSAKTFVEACKQTGMPYLEDYNCGEPIGVSFLQLNARNGRRCHAHKAFLEDIRDTRGNLVIKTKSLVTKLIINKETKEVEGVEYRTDSKLYTALASKEVILTAGTHFSPHLLMLSGIGPKKNLEEFGIEVIKDLPVGKTIYDHVTFPGLVFKINSSLTPASSLELMKAENIQNFLNKGDGPLVSPGGIEAIAFIKTAVSKEKIDYPDVELGYYSGSYSSDFGMFMRKGMRFSDESYNTIWKPLENKSVWTVIPVSYFPKSSGYMKLQSSDPSVPPKFYANYFTDPERTDMKTMIAAIRKVQEIAKAPAFAEHGSEQVLTPLPNCRRYEIDSDDFWECQIRSISSSLWHQIGPCRMGPKDDPKAVVDHELRVYGVKNLRVGDVSVVPQHLAGHTNVPTTMIGEKLADLILKAHSS